MAADKFILDHKVYMPRMRRFRKRLDPDIAPWRRIKDAVRSDEPMDWQEIIKRFRVGDLLGPESLKPASRDAHRDLKGVYTFFQHGYIVRNNDYAALHARVDKRQRLTTGHSILLSSTPTALGEHAGGIRKIESYTESSLGASTPVPFAIGYSELHSEGAQRYPAYVWLLHEVECPPRLARVKTRRARPDGDSFVGMKNLPALYEGRIRCDGSAARVTGAFDKLLIEMLATDRESVTGPQAGIRRLKPEEIANIPSLRFKARNERLRRRLTLLGLLRVAAIGSPLVARDAVDWARRTEWVQENWSEISDLLAQLTHVGASYF